MAWLDSLSVICLPIEMTIATVANGMHARPNAARVRDPRKITPNAAPIRIVTRALLAKLMRK